MPHYDVVVMVLSDARVDAETEAPNLGRKSKDDTLWREHRSAAIFFYGIL